MNTEKNKHTWLEGSLGIFHWLEDAIIVLVLLGMVALAVVQIVMRNLADTSFVWIDPLLQNAVLWIAILGAMIASRNDSHIRIDILSEYLPPQWHRFLLLLVDIFTAAATLGMAYFSYLALMEERTFNTSVVAGVQAWKLQVLLPLGFAVIGLRYTVLFLLGLVNKRPLHKSHQEVLP